MFNIDSDKALAFLSLFNILCLLFGLCGLFRLACLTTASINGRADSNMRFLFSLMSPLAIRAIQDPFISFKIDMIAFSPGSKPIFVTDLSALESTSWVSRTLKKSFF